MPNNKTATVLDLIADPHRPVPPGFYNLPLRDARDRVVIPMSGGADSSALAIVVRRLLPEIPAHYVFFDTGAEPAETYESLDNIEAYLGVPITRMVPKRNLFQLIEDWNGFLPSNRNRWCTRALKIEPYERWLNALLADGGRALTLVGLRADEDRVGLISRDDRVIQWTPLRDLGLGKREVFRILEATVGIPAIYARGRTRSGCTACPFQSARELIGALQSAPADFARGEAVEIAKLSDLDRSRWLDDALAVSVETGLGRNHLGAPIPPRIDCRTRDSAQPVLWGSQDFGRRHRAQSDLFGPVREAYALVEFFVHPGVGAHGVWWSALVGWSATRSGIQAHAERHWWHRLATSEAMQGLSPEQMREELNLAIYRLLLPQHVDLDGPGEGSFTWKSGLSYRQLRYVTGWIARTLHKASIEQQIADCSRHPRGWKGEALEALEAAHAAITAPVGEVIAMDRYDPRSDAPPEADEREITCIACSI